MNHTLIEIDENEIKDRYLSGSTVGDIADYLSVSDHLVRGRLRKMGLFEPTRKGRRTKQDPSGATHEIYFRSKKAIYVLTCLKCSRPFKSWDKVKNRLCKRCNERNGEGNYRNLHRMPMEIGNCSNPYDKLGGYAYSIDPDKLRQKAAPCPVCGQMQIGGLFRYHKCFANHLTNIDYKVNGLGRAMVS